MKNNIVIEVRKIFSKYRKNKLIIENYEIINNNFNNEISNQDIKKIKDYVLLIDNILNELDKMDSWILKNIFIERKEKDDLNYSESTFYWRLRKASNNFIGMLKW